MERTFVRFVSYNREVIYFLTGENWYARDMAVKVIVERAGEAPEYIDTEKATVDSLRELLGAQTLFSQARTVMLRQPSENKALWGSFDAIAAGVADDITLIITEDKPDKRTKTYKALQKQATTKDFPNWTDRDAGFATEWLLREAKLQGIPLKTRDAQALVRQVGVDQGRLASALEKIALMPEITGEAIEASIDTHAVDNVFILLETALRGEVGQVQEMIRSLRQTEDAYRVFGLLGSQLTQLAALVYSKDSPNDVAHAIGAAPFVLSKLAPYAARISERGMHEILEWAADTDMKMKSVAIDPWVLVGQLLLKVASR